MGNFVLDSMGSEFDSCTQHCLLISSDTTSFYSICVPVSHIDAGLSSSRFKHPSNLPDFLLSPSPHPNDEWSYKLRKDNSNDTIHQTVVSLTLEISCIFDEQGTQFDAYFPGCCVVLWYIIRWY